jgi:hypothetical protein
VRLERLVSGRFTGVPIAAGALAALNETANQSIDLGKVIGFAQSSAGRPGLSRCRRAAVNGYSFTLDGASCLDARFGPRHGQSSFECVLSFLDTDPDDIPGAHNLDGCRLIKKADRTSHEFAATLEYNACPAEPPRHP